VAEHPRPLRVLHVVTDTDRRGAQIFGVELGRALTSLGHRVTTAALAPGPAGGLDVPVLGPRRLAISTLRALRREVRSAEVVVAFGSSTLPACAAATIGTRTPFVYRSIGEMAFWSNTRARRTRSRAGLARAAAVVVLWERAATSVREGFGVDAARLHVIPRGVSASEFRPASPAQQRDARHALGLEPDRPTVLYLGALSPEKRVELAIQAMAELPEHQLLIAGDGPDRARLEAEASSVAPERVRFAGVVNPALHAIAAADVIVLPSRSEGMPGVLIEAGLCGMPAAATDVGGVADVIVDGVTGRVVDPAVSPADLAGALRWAYDHRAEAGAAARRRCLERFEIGVVARQWETLLHRVVTSPASLATGR
jgi:glycosyltransferase involved in cell wall biosynthesis